MGFYPDNYSVQLVIYCPDANDLNIPDEQFQFILTNPNGYTLWFTISANYLYVYNGTTWVEIDNRDFTSNWKLITWTVKGLKADYGLWWFGETASVTDIDLYTDLGNVNYMTIIQKPPITGTHNTYIDSLNVKRKI